MRRRDLIVLLGGAALLRAPIGRAQEPGRVYRLGILAPASDAAYAPLFDELRRLGFVEGKNVQVDFRGSVRAEEAPKLAETLVAAGVDAILAGGETRIRAAQKATRTIPILALDEDLLRHGLVSSLAHPGGNTTGISILSTELDGKRQDLLTELVPAARHIAALGDPASTLPEQLRALQDAAQARGIELSVYWVSKPEEIVAAIEKAQASGAQALNVLATPLFFANQRLIIERTAALKLPAIYQWPEIAEAGGLAAYGPRITGIFRQRARQLAKILRGAKPAEIPVEQPYKFELVINLKTADALGLTVPPLLLAMADKEIE
jgi:putative tryptophan/tyrosine transport system substrate-binding protein